MIIYVVRHCDYCHSSIGKGQRWVRQKIYSPSDEAPRYRHYHAEPSQGQSESCWEKQLEQAIARTAA